MVNQLNEMTILTLVGTAYLPLNYYRFMNLDCFREGLGTVFVGVVYFMSGPQTTR